MGDERYCAAHWVLLPRGKALRSNHSNGACPGQVTIRATSEGVWVFTCQTCVEPPEVHPRWLLIYPLLEAQDLPPVTVAVTPRFRIFKRVTTMVPSDPTGALSGLTETGMQSTWVQHMQSARQTRVVHGDTVLFLPLCFLCLRQLLHFSLPFSASITFFI